MKNLSEYTIIVPTQCISTNKGNCGIFTEYINIEDPYSFDHLYIRE